MEIIFMMEIGKIIYLVVKEVYNALKDNFSLKDKFFKVKFMEKVKYQSILTELIFLIL